MMLLAAAFVPIIFAASSDIATAFRTCPAFDAYQHCRHGFYNRRPDATLTSRSFTQSRSDIRRKQQQQYLSTFHQDEESSTRMSLTRKLTPWSSSSLYTPTVSPLSRHLHRIDKHKRTNDLVHHVSKHSTTEDLTLLSRASVLSFMTRIFLALQAGAFKVTRRLSSLLAPTTAIKNTSSQKNNYRFNSMIVGQSILFICRKMIMPFLLGLLVLSSCPIIPNKNSFVDGSEHAQSSQSSPPSSSSSLLWKEIFSSSSVASAAAVTGGRMGGDHFFSEKSSSSSSYSSRPSTSNNNYLPRSSSSRSALPKVHINIIRPPPSRTIIYHNNFGSRPRDIYYSRNKDTIVTSTSDVSERFSVTDVVVLTGVGALMFQGFKNNYRERDRDSLHDHTDGRKKRTRRQRNDGIFTVASLTMALNVPNRNNPQNILQSVHDISLTARTDTRRGLQNMISTVALELLRQEMSITSVSFDTRSFDQLQSAQRAFHEVSVRERSKFERESANPFGFHESTSKSLLARPTFAVVTITICLRDGDDEGGALFNTKNIKTHDQLRTILSRIAAGVQVDDSLLAGEVLWAPSDLSSTETLTNEDVMADYPNLIPLLN